MTRYEAPEHARETPGLRPPGITTPMALLLAFASGSAVANVYYAQPLLERIGHDLGVGPAGLGLVTTVTQVGYFVGLIVIVPLGDLFNRRLLIPAGCLTCAAGLIAVAVSPGSVTFFVASGIVGLAAVVQQVIIAYATVLSSPEVRGRVLGIVTSGVVIGILLARTVSGLLADLFGWRWVFVVSAALMVAVAVVLFRRLPSETTTGSYATYRRLLLSVVTLTVHERVFRVRSLLTLFMFAGFGALWGSIALPLSAEPWRLSTSEVGLFGLVGAAGAVGAARAGALADKGPAQRVTGIVLVLFALSWIPIAWLPHSLLALIILAIGGLVACGNPEPRPAPTASADQGGIRHTQAGSVTRLMTRDLPDLPGKEGMIEIVDFAPGEASQVHRHNCDLFVYVLEGSVVTQVKGASQQTVNAGGVFYESPTDIHIVSRNASQTRPAKLAVFYVKAKGTPPTEILADANAGAPR